MEEEKASKGENWVEDLQQRVIQSKDSAVRSARSFQSNSSTHFRSLQDFVPNAISQYRAYEEAFFKKVKEELMSAREHPTAVVGVAVAAGLLLMPGPRRLLFRHTLGRFQSEEAKYVKVEKNVKELNLSVDLMKKESRKLLERAALAEKDMTQGHTELRKIGNEIEVVNKYLCKTESQATDVMDTLREISGREALKLRAEVASMASLLKQHRTELDKRMMKISELGVAV
ncbi:hypothetical protein HS088_TW04G00809 [Tripterygium wilfordii]|uniref:Uncharacterized protein n=1 Tax=Tripterygium wilfordii TaxID=458696 RepID=A0A7J7DRE2_TRIWF|nr:RGS1-HXK1-interacting protein 1 [Tripterygium wilfordii]KAF5748849.1 hypothetical protein HS088_TW04G00809 [Tripterygium wilfordii]